MPPEYEGKLPDLAVTKFQYLPENPLTTDRLMLSFAIQNQGEGLAIFRNGTVYIEFDSLTSSYKNRWAISTDYMVKPGEFLTGGQYMYEPGALAPGTYTVHVTADPDNSVEESNESNNSYVYTFILADGGTPDLIIESIEVVPPHDQVTYHNIYVNVKNQGTGKAIFPYNSTILSSPDFSSKTATPSAVTIEAGGTEQFWFTRHNLPPGTYVWQFTVDPSNKVQESDETNNTASVNVSY
jgi:subtilase family serine protease